MKNKGFRSLVEKGLREKVRFESENQDLQDMTHEQVIKLQLVMRAIQGDTSAVKEILKELKETKPAPARKFVHLYSLDGDDNVVDSQKNIVGPLSAFPNLPDVSGPTLVPKEWLIPVTVPKKKRRKPR
jgi:hypothetical protein